MKPHVLILGDGPCARSLAQILGLPRVERRAEDEGWDWPKPAGRKGKVADAVLLLIAADPSLGTPLWIRRHEEARACPLARRTGVMLFGMAPILAKDLFDRDVFARTGAMPDTDQTFGTWGADLRILDDRSSLGDLLAALASLETLPQTTWDSLRRRANCLPAFFGVLERRDAEALPVLVAELNRIDWDARCFPHPIYGDPHAWANRIGTWLRAVTAGVPPDWEEGLALFLPLEQRTA
jgi:hypothetical protein